MNPITWLFIVAPAAVLAAVLFIWVYQDNSSRADLVQAQSKVERLEFDRDFAKAWNGQKIEAPDNSALDQAKAKVVALETAESVRRKEQCKRLARLSNDLENSLKSQESSSITCKEDAN